MWGRTGGRAGRSEGAALGLPGDGGEGGKGPGGLEGAVGVAGEEEVVGVGAGVEPAEQGEEVGAGEGGAAVAGFIGAAADVEEDGAAVAGERGVGVVADFEEEFVGEVAEAHALAGVPGRGVGEVDGEVLVVGGEGGVVDPAVAGGDAVGGEAEVGKGLGVFAVKGADTEETGGGALIFFAFGGDAWLAVRDGEGAVAPGEAALAEHGRVGRFPGGEPGGGGAGALEGHELGARGVPIGGKADDELADGAGEEGGWGGEGGEGEGEEKEGAGRRLHGAAEGRGGAGAEGNSGAGGGGGEVGGFSRSRAGGRESPGRRAGEGRWRREDCLSSVPSNSSGGRRKESLGPGAEGRSGRSWGGGKGVPGRDDWAGMGGGRGSEKSAGEAGRSWSEPR